MRKGGIRKRLLWLFCRWLLLGGVCALAVGIGFGLYTSFFLFRSASASGRIVRLDTVPDEENGTTNYAPVFSFTAGDGKTYTVRSGVSTNPPEFDEGDTVPVLYARSNPGNAKIDSFWQLWTVTVICSGLGLIFGVPGYLLLRFERKRNRQALIDSSASQAISK